MPVFTEESPPIGETQVNRAQNTPLPFLSETPGTLEQGCYDVVVVGAGPAGLMLSVLLTRYGIDAVLSIDDKTESIKSGHADGLQPRTLEVLQNLDLAHDILTQGCTIHEISFWNPANNGKGPGVERTSSANDVNVASRYPYKITIHQGRIEDIFSEDLQKRGQEVKRGWRVTGWKFDYANAEYPVLISVDDAFFDKQFSVRAKHLVGADGAKSVIRLGMGVSMLGDYTDHVWGVIDSVISTNFPDIRKRCAVHSSAGSIMIIPRERISHTEVLTRIYCQMEDAEHDPSVDNEQTPDINSVARQRREKVTLERIISQIKRVLQPYEIDCGKVDWWAAYQIGQRVAEHFSVPDASGLLRVHIVGDACHTHSPKAGQGMNVSMMDSYNLAWKLSHVINGLSPNPNELLSTYETERLCVAQQLIEFDRKMVGMFSGKIGEEHGITPEAFAQLFLTAGGFTSGCGIEYPQGLLVWKSGISTRKSRYGYLQSLRKLLGVCVYGAREKSQDKNRRPDLGALTPGRRLMNVKVKRFADACPRNIHDDIPSDGRYRIMIMLPAAHTITPELFFPLLKLLSHNLPTLYPASLIETIVIYPDESKHKIEWATHFPPEVKAGMNGRGEWLVFSDKHNEAYVTYDVDPGVGAVVVVRPDGYVALAMEPKDGDGVGTVLRGYFDGVLKRV